MSQRLRVAVVVLCGIIILMTRNVPYTPSSRLFLGYETKLQIVERLHAQREKIAMDYFKHQKEVYQHEIPSEVDVAVVIVTMKREQNNSDYVVHTAAYMDKALRADRHFNTTFMFVCNVDNHPERHTGATHVAKYLPYIQKVASKNNLGISEPIAIPEIRPSDQIEKRRWQEIGDYVFCLNASMIFKPKFVLVLEDDVIPSDYTLSTLYYTLKHRLAVLDQEPERPRKPFTYLRLFYLLREEGFISIVAFGDLFKHGCLECIVGIFELLGLMCVFTVPLYLWQVGLNAVSTDVRVNVKVMRVCAVTVMVISLVASRNGMMEIRRVSPQLYYLGHGRLSITSAVLYPSYIVPDLVQHLQQNTDRHKDLELYKFSVQTGRKGYQLEPNIFSHIGVWSSLRGQRPIDEFIK